jgi:hypothetical protein
VANYFGASSRCCRFFPTAVLSLTPISRATSAGWARTGDDERLRVLQGDSPIEVIARRQKAGPRFREFLTARLHLCRETGVPCYSMYQGVSSCISNRIFEAENRVFHGIHKPKVTGSIPVAAILSSHLTSESDNAPVPSHPKPPQKGEKGEKVGGNGCDENAASVPVFSSVYAKVEAKVYASKSNHQAQWQTTPRRMASKRSAIFQQDRNQTLQAKRQRNPRPRFPTAWQR